jgi:hypothetical protein
MIAYKKEVTVDDHGVLVLDDLPFGAGADVEVIVLERRDGARSVDRETAGDEDRYPLRGSVLRYDDPTEPVAVEDWEALQ